MLDRRQQSHNRVAATTRVWRAGQTDRVNPPANEQLGFSAGGLLIKKLLPIAAGLVVTLPLGLSKLAMIDIALLVQSNYAFNNIFIRGVDAGSLHHRTPAQEQNRNRLCRETCKMRFLQQCLLLRLTSGPILYNVHRGLVCVNETAAKPITS